MSFIAAAAAAGTTVAAMQAAAIAGVTASQIAAAAAAAAAAAEAAAVATAATAATVGAEAAIVAPTIVAPVAPGGIAATGSSSIGSLGTGIVETAGEKVLGQGAKEVAKKGIEQLGRNASEKVLEQGAKEVGKETIERSALEVAKDSNDQLLTKLPQYYTKAPSSQGINVAGDIPSGGINMTAPKPLPAFPEPPPANPLLSSVPEPVPLQPSTPTQNAFSRMDAFSDNALRNVKPSSGGNNSFSSMDAFNRNAVNNLNQGWKAGPSAPTVPAGTSSAGGEATKDAWALALEDQGATAAQRTAMENSAKTFGDIGGKYESAITKTPVEKSLLNKAGEFVMDNKLNIALGGLGLMQMMPPESGVNPISESMIRPYTYSEEDTSDQEADPRGREKIRYSSSYAAGTPYKAAQGGLLSLHRGGNFLSGGGDGMSDDIPAMIGTKQPARLADGEFVIPADVVSHIGNGSSKAGAAKLYAMMDKIRQERTGRKRQSPQINAAKYLPR